MPSVTTTGPGRRPAARPTLVDEDPRAILARALASVQERRTQDDIELAEARHALARLHDTGQGREPGVARITLEVASSLVQELVASTTGPMRQLIMSTSVGATPQDDAVDAFTRDVIAAGRPQLSIYDASLLADPEAVAVAASYRQIGEQQRIVEDVPTEFGVYGEDAVVCVETWGDPASDYVLVREPMLVAAFIAYFDEVWARALPMPSGRLGGDDDDEQLLDLLARGYKDEAIARYLGWSLRTVRRRVARLMDELGARTRFQLGAQAVRSGRMTEAPRPGTLPGARLGRAPASR